MTRNLKAMGLALVAVIALSAAVASAASAQGKLTTTGPTTLTGMETGPPSANGFTAFGAQIRCPGSIYTGHKVLTVAETEPPISKKHESLLNNATTATLTPHYKELTAGGAPNCVATVINGTITVDMNGCDYVIHIGATVAAGEYAVTFDVVCPTGKEITVTMFHNGNPGHTTPYCTVHIPPQNNLAGAKALNTASGHIGIIGEIVGITATATSHGTVLCPHQTTNNAKYDIDVTVSGDNAGGTPTAISLSH